MSKTIFDRAARRNRHKALWFTLLIHAGLLGGILFATDADTDWKQYLPDTLQEWMKEAPEQQPEKKVDKKKKA
ncbi:MAG: hypothetical protein AAFP19_24665 [Bacteroidota bacterium]